jgi:gluconate kinase
MVIVLMGPGAAGTTSVARALAERLGWAFVAADRTHSLDSLHARVVHATDRREPLILACPVALSADDRARVAGSLRPVRFVALGAERVRADDHVLALNGSADIDTIIGHVRLEFGV